jgi:hypothetical protein
MSDMFQLEAVRLFPAPTRNFTNGPRALNNTAESAHGPYVKSMLFDVFPRYHADFQENDIFRHNTAGLLFMNQRDTARGRCTVGAQSHSSTGYVNEPYIPVAYPGIFRGGGVNKFS